MRFLNWFKLLLYLKLFVIIKKGVNMAKKKFYYKKSDKAQITNVYDAKMEEAARKVPLEQLGLSESTLKLLLDNNLKTASDLVKKTEKDMYKIQMFGKKQFIEISKCLRKKGFVFATRNDQPKVHETQQQANDKAAKPNVQPVKQEKVEEKLPNRKFFTLSGKLRQGEGRPHYGVEEVKQLKPPYPPEEWRKVQRGTKWGFYDGIKNVIPPVYDEVFSFKEGLALVELDEKCGYIDSNNNTVIPFDYEAGLSFSEGFAMVVKNGKCGYVDKNNKLIVDFQFDAATPFEDGSAKVKKDGKWGQLEKDGTVKWNAR